MKSAITPGTAPAIERPIHRGVYRPFGGGRRKSLSRRFADILKGRTAIAYDPQNLTTMYQYAAGTLPVYRPGTGLVDPPVGLMMDKSQGLLGPELVTNGDFSDGLTGWSIENQNTKNTCQVIDGRLVITADDTSVPPACWQNVFQLNKIYKISFDVILAEPINECQVRFDWGSIIWIGSTTGTHSVISGPATSSRLRIFIGSPGEGRFIVDNISVREIKGYHAYQSTTTARPTLSGRYNLLTATETLSTQSVTTVATNYTLRFEGTGTVTLSGAATGVLSAGTHTITCTAGTLTLTVAGSVTKADLRVKRDGSSLPAYQRVDSATTYDTVGFPLYLRRDRVDDQHLLTIPTGGITGSYAEGTLDGPIFGTVDIPAGAYAIPVTPATGQATCTQWIAIDGELSESQQTILERYVTNKNGGGMALQLELIETLEMLETVEMK